MIKSGNVWCRKLVKKLQRTSVLLYYYFLIYGKLAVCLDIAWISPEDLQWIPDHHVEELQLVCVLPKSMDNLVQVRGPLGRTQAQGGRHAGVVLKVAGPGYS